ncbi:MAG: hypothetical protein HQK53_19090, partial [Oligoflexia bacterium]|nr:hypothetical protein [Oligoflexia bacterium]
MEILKSCLTEQTTNKTVSSEVTINMDKDEEYTVKRAQKGPRYKILKRPEIILIGASTGGVNVLNHILRDMPSDSPPVVVVQHIEESFAKTFAKKLSETSNLPLIMDNRSFLKRGHL